MRSMGAGCIIGGFIGAVAAIVRDQPIADVSWYWLALGAIILLTAKENA